MDENLKIVPFKWELAKKKYRCILVNINTAIGFILELLLMVKTDGTIC